MIAETPQPPNYAVIFTSLRAGGDNSYGDMAAAMNELAKQQPGYLGIESAREGLRHQGFLLGIFRSHQKLESQYPSFDCPKQGREQWYV